MYMEIQSEAVAKSYMRKGFLIYEEMRKYLQRMESLINSIIFLCPKNKVCGDFMSFFPPNFDVKETPLTKERAPSVLRHARVIARILI